MVKNIKLPQWYSLPISRAVNFEHRLDASAYNTDALTALSKVKHYKYGVLPLWGNNGIVNDAFVGNRFKRIYTESDADIPFFLPSDIENVYPKASKHISKLTKTNIEALRVRKGMLLISCSGTIGKTTIVNDFLDNQVFSHDLLRVTFNSEYDLGYTYAFFNTDDGLNILRSNNYGSVIDHIEPEHLRNIIIPNAPIKLRQEIHNLVMESFELRDRSNELISKAQTALCRELMLPPIDEIKPKQYDTTNLFRCVSLKAAHINGRLDVSYHVPEIEAIVDAIRNNAAELVRLGDPRLSKKIILAGIFKRTYVDSSSGVPFLGGRDMMTLTPKVSKFLSIAVHKKRIDKELAVRENYILVSDRGTIGKVQIVPKHWNGWAVSQNIIKIVPSEISIAGYLYAFLSTEYARRLIIRETYGSVVDMIDDDNMASVPIPILKDKDLMKQINDEVIQANQIRYNAHLKETEALDLMHKILDNKV